MFVFEAQRSLADSGFLDWMLSLKSIATLHVNDYRRKGEERGSTRSLPVSPSPFTASSLCELDQDVSIVYPSSNTYIKATHAVLVYVYAHWNEWQNNIQTHSQSGWTSCVQWRYFLLITELTLPPVDLIYTWAVVGLVSCHSIVLRSVILPTVATSIFHGRHLLVT